VEIDKTTQTLRAYDGDKLYLETRVSTGKWDRSTPNGQFQAGDKFRMHRSRLFNDAPMPFSVEVTGNVFIHGFSSVPRWPASHGCIRVPLGDGNPAKQFYDWVETGTPIEITGHWQGRK
jgi:lipoprotein-anchoring transpeptidase ErfK/SrfK